MKINISYREPLKFEQFKEQFQHHFTMFSHVKKESEMKKAWEKAETKVKSKAGVKHLDKIMNDFTDVWDEIENTDQLRRNRSE